MLSTRTQFSASKALVAAAALAFVGACADSVGAPVKEVSAKVPAAYTTVVGVVSFVYTPDQGASQRIGDHVIVIPADGICDPETSGYGVDYWDAPCTAVDHSITITATAYADDAGHPYVDFQPALRFVPTKETYLYLHDGRRDKATDLEIAYCPTGSYCRDESIADPSLATHRVGKSANLYRRLKHFSGYLITAGDECSTGVVSVLDDGSLYCDTGDDGFTRTGYMVASGLSKVGTTDTFGRRRRAEK